ncbi:MAG: TonB-dependent receptor [Hydrocarboniphaga sp.]|uniref:TonB-dependent receptor domain-containing protein n=1 Tax=Hydrocarboniphaga sp. TaxID=2033016 RepID=UPI00262C9EF1|nr:TonB-dependent receptor [Hydrocarboniphaga sp.]MDB5972106.1 TonB-dependent receptor [Hydrocarboniphaga sp.]
MLAAVIACGPIGSAAAADLDRRLNFDIPAQLLSTALTQLSQQSHIQIVAPAASINTLQSPKVQGRYSITEALTRLLAGAPLEYRVIGSDTLVLSALDAEPEPQAAPRSRAGDRPCIAAHCPEPAAAIEVQPVELVAMSVYGAGQVRAANALTQPYFRAQVPGFAPQAFLNLLPGVDMQSTDPFGLYEFGTSVRIRGFTADQLAITLDGVPLEETPDTRGDTPPNRYIDNENLDELQVAQGSADVDTPSFHALGGSLRYSTLDPAGVWQAAGSYTGGSEQMSRVYGRVDTAPLWTGGPIAMFSASQIRAYQQQNSLASMQTERAQFKAIQTLPFGQLMFGWLYGDRDDHDVDSYNIDGSPDLIYTQKLSGDGAADARYYDYWRNGRTDNLLMMRADIGSADDAHLQIQPYYESKRGYGTAGVTPDAAQTLYDDALAGAPQRSDVQPPDSGGAASGRLEQLQGERRGVTLSLQRTLGVHRLTVGGWLQQYDFTQTRPLYDMDTDGTLHTDALPITIYYDRRIDTATRQFYAKDSIALFGERATLAIGSKGLIVDRRASGYLNNDDFNRQQRETRTKTDQDLLQPQVGFVWRYAGNVELFANYAENFSATPRLAFVASSFNADLKPETSDNIDLGIRSTGSHFASAVSVYHIAYRHRVLELQATDPDIVGVDTYENVGAIETLGVETSLYWNPALHWRIGSTLSLNRSRFQDDYEVYDDVLGSHTVDSAGKTVPATPGRMATLDVSWRGRDGFVGADAKYTGPRYGSTTNSERVGGYTVINLNVGRSHDFGAGRISLQANVYNLLNHRYYGMLVPGEDTGTYNFGISRSLYISVGLQW